MESVCEILSQFGLDAEVQDCFCAHKLDDVDLIAELTQEELTEIGIVALGDRKKLAKLIDAVKSGRVQPQSPNRRKQTSPVTSANPRSTSVSPSQDPAVLTRSQAVLPAPLSGKSGLHIVSVVGASTASPPESPTAPQDVRPVPDAVPDRREGWEKSFVIPTQFSETTMRLLARNQLSSSARNEIVRAVASKMLANCKYPSHYQFIYVAKMIVDTLFDGKGESIGEGYESWSAALKQRFKNVRRKSQYLAMGVKYMPPCKRKSVDVPRTTGRSLALQPLLNSQVLQLSVPGELPARPLAQSAQAQQLGDPGQPPTMQQPTSAEQLSTRPLAQQPSQVQQSPARPPAQQPPSFLEQPPPGL